jgi:5-methylcytosine-specific restriction endonuclease McrA
MPPQCAALPLVVNSSFGVSSGASSTTSLATVGERGHLSKPVQVRHWPRKGFPEGKRKGRPAMTVLVVDKHHQPLMPCSEKRARLLLSRGRAVVHRRAPFVIRLKDRIRAESSVQEVAVKLDPGSKTTGLAVVRIAQGQEGEDHHALLLANLTHRGERVRRALQQRAGYRRRRRTANLRHRPARFHNRRRAEKWFPPSLRSRIGNVLTWMRRFVRWAPVSRIEVERVAFDTQLLQNPQISGVSYQRGELFGWEMRAYVLEKFGYRCAYCHTEEGPFELEHIQPRSRGGSNRVSNLALSCHACNVAKGNLTADEWGHPEVEVQARMPLRDAAAMNASRYALVEALRSLGLSILTWSGGRTRWNRDRYGIEKDHCLDALCVGDVVGVHQHAHHVLLIRAQGRGSYQRTNVDASGFPRGYLTRTKRIRGFATGDLVRATVPAPLKMAGAHVGRVAVRASGSFRVGKRDGINAMYCQLLQRADGYEATWKKKEAALPPQA